MSTEQRNKHTPTPAGSAWRWMWRYLSPVRWKMASLTALLLATTGLSLVNPMIVQQFINVASAKGAVGTLVVLAAIYLGFAVVNQLMTVAVTYIGGDVAWRSTNQVRVDLMRHCLRLDLSFHNVRTPGEMIERIDGDVTALSNFFSQFLVNILRSLALLVGIVVVMMYADWRVGTGMLAFTVVSIIILVSIRNMGVGPSQAERQSSAELFGLVEERLAGIEDVQANGATGYVMRRYYQSMRRYFVTGRKAWMLRVVPFNVTTALYAVSILGVLGYGAWMYLRHGMSLGTLYLFYQYTQMLNDPLEQLGNQLQDYQRAQSSLRRIRELFAQRPGVQDGAGAALSEGPLSLTFQDVTFGYTVGDPVLKNIDLHLEAGQVMGVVGRTGSGKSSLIRLLLRLYNVQDGCIRLGDVDVKDLTLAQLYSRIGMVTQDVQLFEATVRDNITLFDESVTDAEVLATLRRLGLSEWLNRLPNGLDTVLATGGNSVSAGEAQLLALTRLFLKKPSLVILDEPSSRLDPATESLLQQAVNELLETCTGIIIAHRLSTLKQVDKILVLQDGGVLEYGDRKALAADPSSRYAKLLETEWMEAMA